MSIAARSTPSADVPDIMPIAITTALSYAAARGRRLRRVPPPLAPRARIARPPEAEFGESRTAGIIRILELLGSARARSDAQLASVADDALTRPSLWGTYEMDVRRRVNQIAAHLTETTVQIEKLLSVRGDLEGRRIVRRCAMVRGLHERWSDAGARSALDERYRLIAA